MPTPLAQFKLERYFADWEFRVPFALGSSDCETRTVEELLSLQPGARESLLGLRLGYTESAGSPALRQAITALYQTIAPDQVVVHSGAEEAIFLFMHAVMKPGDHVIVQAPCYQSLAEVARSLGARVAFWRSGPGDEWRFDPGDLRRLIRPDTRLLVINTPHNPTGFHFAADAFSEVLQAAAELGVTVFCDEVYRESEHDPSHRLPAACDLDPAAVSLGVMSKTYGLAGLRIGWLATRNRALLERVLALKDYTTICNSAPAELLAEIALRHRETLVGQTRSLLRQNLDLLDAFFGRHPDLFLWQRPCAGPVAFPRLLRGDVENFCRRAAAEAGVMLIPGTLFEDAGNHFRGGFGRADLPQALAHLAAWVERSRDDW